MGVRTTQGFNFKLVANGVQLDLFKDETITISDNITGLFDVGTLPTDFSRQITLPGSKINNQFFEQYYDISVENPFLFSTSNKVDAYFDFDGLYLASGYLQLNKVNVVANKYVDSYEVTIFGSLASFAREINRSFLTDITTLESLNHTASMYNVTASWEGNLFGGDIVYPLIDYGQDLVYEGAAEGRPAMNTTIGSLNMQDFKPGIRVKAVWDAIFEQFGFTYQSDFLTSSLFDNLYMSLHNGGKYMEFDGVDLETLGQFKISPISGSNTDVVMQRSTGSRLFWENNEYDPQFSIGDNMSYNIGSRPTGLKGEIQFQVNVSGSSGMPQFYFGSSTTQSFIESGSTDNVDWIELEDYNRYLRQEWTVTGGNADQDYDIHFNWQRLGANPNRAYYFYVKYESFQGSNFTVTLQPNASTEGYLTVNQQTRGADNRVIDIADQMPVGESGIKMIDFIQAVQRKFNLIIYPSKTKPKEFIVETFNNWYKQGEVKDFNKYINLDEKLEVIPANNLAVNKLRFGHKADNDLLSQNFKKEANRPYGESFFIDTQNFFSQGEFKVEPADAASPLRYVDGTGISGSASPPLTLYALGYQRTTSIYPYDLCGSILRAGFTDNPAGVIDEGYYVYTNNLGTPLTGQRYVANYSTGDIYSINSTTGLVIAYQTNCADEPTS